MTGLNTEITKYRRRLREEWKEDRGKVFLKKNFSEPNEHKKQNQIMSVIKYDDDKTCLFF
jgi:hypothetical protein